MKGLILKDFLVLRKGARTYLLFLGIYAAISLFSPETDLFSTMLIVVVMMLPMNCFSWDSYTKWDSYAMALPVRRRTVVAARYVLVLLTALGALAMMAALALLSGAIHGGVDWNGFLFSSLISMAGALVINMVMLPLLYKYGPERARVMIIVVMAVVFAGVYLVESTVGKARCPRCLRWGRRRRL